MTKADKVLACYKHLTIRSIHKVVGSNYEYSINVLVKNGLYKRKNKPRAMNKNTKKEVVRKKKHSRNDEFIPGTNIKRLKS